MALYKKLATLFIASLANFSINQSYAAAAFPRGCENSGFVFYRNFLVMNEHGKQSFFLIQNHSQEKIELEHFETKVDAFMSPKLEAQLNPTHWSAFASDIAQMYFRCYVRQGEERVAVDCANFLDVCQYPRARFALSNQGSYWVSTDKSQQQVIKEATAKGIFLHW